MDLSHLRYPRKSHRKIIQLPENSEKLAEFMGIVLGDGGINNQWQLVITVNAKADLLYSHYITESIKDLFALDVYAKERPRNALVLIASSTSLVDFLVTKGAVRGNKIQQQIDLPNWIAGNSRYEKAFVRGLVDTDGCLYIHRHVIKGVIYKNIGFCFASKSEKLIMSTAAILLKNGIKPAIRANNSQIFLYSRKAVELYLALFGSSNPRITNKYNEYILEGCWRGRSGRPGKSV